MEHNLLNPRKALNKAYLKVKANRSEIELFKKNLISLLDKINEPESEEYHKNLVSKFLTDTYYNNKHFINTKGRNDLVIHNGTNPTTTVGVIIEAKKPSNKAEMLKKDHLNCKAFQELVFYYLRERITLKNHEIKHLIATNINEWYIFDAHVFEKEFAQNSKLVKQFTDFTEGRLVGNTTDYFYKEIAAPAIDSVNHEITFTYFDIREYDKPLRNTSNKDDNLLIALFKLLSPEHLLKLPFANDSNSLDKMFYTELLHIIGLTETKEGGKKLIQRKLKGERNAGSLLEGAIVQLDNLDKISRLEKPSRFGSNMEERLFSVALELSITWINRILFLKLLEAQLIKYHKGDTSYAFLNTDKVKGFDDLNTLFFQVLAKKTDERNDTVKNLFAHVPYLNSSLFEPTETEHDCLFISQLKDAVIPVLTNTVIKDNTGKKRTGELTTVEYLFEFLNAYDFSSEGSEEIQEDNKRLINASVLGLIFEKINGYKDGSFFTPGFITMYMCRETIRRAVLQKFNDAKGWNCQTIPELYDSIDDKKEANAIINSLKLCDPAVGSGHFLVSALNEIITIKSELKILLDREGKTLRDYHVEVENDELVVTDDDGGLFAYNPGSRESQRIQETLFHEKQTIIENCLFGVDLNPNSVKICRLRLWIELLKNAYYRSAINRTDAMHGVSTELETLPNIDINIKCGNSLISRYALDADIKSLLKTSNWSINSYRKAVDSYRNAKTKDEKRLMESLILRIKQDFSSEIKRTDPLITRLAKLTSDFYNRFSGNFLFDSTEPYSKKDKELEKKRIQEERIAKMALEELEKVIDDRKNNIIYDRSFEWRFEFPEVLNDDGDFIGFDVIIGNPPYVNSKGDNFERSFKEFAIEHYQTSRYQIDTYILFIEKAISLLKPGGDITYITPNAWLNNLFLSDVRKYFIEKFQLNDICNMPSNVFEEAVVDTIILIGKNSKQKRETRFYNCIDFKFNLVGTQLQLDFLKNDNCNIFFLKNDIQALLKKIESKSRKLQEFTSIARGVGVYHKRVGHTKEIISQDPYQSKIQKDETFVPYLRGKNIKAYFINWNEDSYISYGKWLAEPREPKFFEGDRILLRQIPGDKLIAATINKKFIADQSVFIARFESSEINPNGVLGIINSKLIIYYFRNKHSEFDDLFPKVKLQHFKEFPIKTEPEIIFNRITHISKKIEQNKINNTMNDSNTLESEIDQLVYQLYGLTEEEIRIVEGEK